MTVRVLLGVTGGIAAYKAASLVRRLREQGHHVRCAVTPRARSFVTPLTLEVLSQAPVYGEEYLEATGQGRELHIDAAQWSDVLVIAPATCHVLARLALGLADDFLTTTALAFSGPVVVAPAMHPHMWARETVQEHVATLRRRGVEVVGPVSGPLASGEHGMGRMVEPEEIVAALEPWVRQPDAHLAGRTVLVTAGPTHEPVDPVRFLTNRSSGKMGFALARAAARRGARVELVTGPVKLDTPAGVKRHDVTTAHEMQHAVFRLAPRSHLIIMAAAVSDYRPAVTREHKLKRTADSLTLTLEPNPDILAGLADVAPRAVRVGFAAETEDLIAHAEAKLKQKGVAFLVANDVSRSDIGFGNDANEVLVFSPDRPPVSIDRKPKDQVAAELLDLFAGALDNAPEDAPATGKPGTRTSRP